MAINHSVGFTLDEAVQEMLMQLTGLGVTYEPDADRYHVLAHTLNRGLRAVAIDHEWSYFSDQLEVGQASAGTSSVELTSRHRLRVTEDDAVRLEDDRENPVIWAYVLPRDALHKYRYRKGLWCAATRTRLDFSRPFLNSEDGLRVIAPVMREPRMFDLPARGDAVTEIIRNQEMDFDFPDLVIARAMFMYAQTNPLLQPRVPSLEDQFNTLKYSLVERDLKHSDSSYLNPWNLGIANGLRDRRAWAGNHGHPHADDRRL